MPARPTLPLLHGCVPAHSMQSSKSRVSRIENKSMKPGERPVPRESTRTHTYPSGTHFSGSTTSQLWHLLVDPAGTSGCSLIMISHAVSYPSLKSSHLAYGP